MADENEVYDVDIDRWQLYDIAAKAGWSNVCSPETVQQAVDCVVGERQLMLTDDSRVMLELTLKSLLSNIRSRWIQCGRRKDRLRQRYTQFMDTQQSVQVELLEKMEHSGEESRPTRPQLSFSELSARTKRRKSMEVATDNESEKLLQATSQRARKEKKHDLAFLAQEASASPNRPRKIREAYRARHESARAGFSADEALAMAVAGDLSKRSYQLIGRKTNERTGMNVYPSYERVLEARKRCYPSGVACTENMGEVLLQDLVDHTSRRLASAHEEAIIQLTSNLPAASAPLDAPSTSSSRAQTCRTGHLVYKWGMDGATGQSVYKQKTSDQQSGAEESLFCSTVVPLQLVIEGKESWRNPKPSSTRLCRPVRLQFEKETAELIKSEEKKMKDQISELQPTLVQLSDGTMISIRHEFHLTMIDGKVATVISGEESAKKSSMTCNICGAKPKEMNDLQRVIQRESDEDALQIGLSTLHAWIRTFEWILHVGYRMDLKTWAVRGDDNKGVMMERKRKVQAEFRRQLGLHVDQPRAGGSGTSNDGNTARRAFGDPPAFSEITGVDQGLIERLQTILEAINSTEPIDADKFGEFAFQTAQLYVQQYPWYYMPASAHKLLVHGRDVISRFLLPIGMFSEEAQEARNKHFRSFRLHHARKDSRLHTMTDLMNHLFVTSDPVISEIVREEMSPDAARKSDQPRNPLLIPMISAEDDDELCIPS